MELLLNTTQSKKRWQIMTEAVLACLLSLSLMYAFIRTFGLYWSISTAFTGGVFSGFAEIWNQIAVLLGSKEYILLNMYMGADQKYGLAITLLGIFLILPSYMIVKSKNRLLLLIYPVLALMPNVLWGLGLEWKGVTFVAVAVMTAYYFVTPNFRPNSIIPMGICLLLTLLMMMGSSLISSGWQDDLAGFLKTPADTIASGIEDMRYGKNPIGKDDVAMEVTMEKPQQMWLRGFVGERFTKRGWDTLPNDSHYRYLKDKEAMENSGFDPVNQMNRAGNLAKSLDGTIGGEIIGEKESKDQKVKVDVKDASSKHIYAPYELTDSHIQSGKNYGDSFWRSKGIFPKKGYEYTVGFEKASIWTNILGELTTRIRGSEMDEYRKEEYAVNALNYSKYLELSDDDIILMAGSLGDPGDQSEGHVGYREAVDNISKYVNEKILYVNHQRGGINPGNAVKSGKADIRNLATLTTLMFRYYGIPARYVEGYQVRPDDVKKAKANKPMAIKGKNFSAWTEIYVDGYGWAPIQLAEELQKDMKMADLSKGLDTTDPDGAFKPYVPPTPPENNEDKENNDNMPNLFGNNQLNINVIILLVILAMLLLLLLIILAYLWYQRVWKRLKAFKDEDNNRATQAIYSALLSKNVPLTDENIAIGNRAAYSRHKIADEERQTLLARWKVRRKLIREAKNV